MATAPAAGRSKLIRSSDTILVTHTPTSEYFTAKGLLASLGWTTEGKLLGGANVELPYTFKDLLTKKKKEFRKAFEYAKPNIRYLLAAGLLTSLTSFISVWNAKLFRDFIDTAVKVHDLNRMLLLCAGMAIVPIILGLCTKYSSKMQRRFTQKVTAAVKADMYRHYQRLGIRFFIKVKKNDLLVRLNDASAVAQIFSSGFIQPIKSILDKATSIGILFALAPKISAAMFIFWVVLNALKRLKKKQFDRTKLQKAQSELNSWLDDTLSHPGAFLTKMFGMQDHNVEVYTEKSAVVDKLQRVQTKFNDLERMDSVLAHVQHVANAVMYAALGYCVHTNELKLGDINLFRQYSGSLQTPLSLMFSTYSTFMSNFTMFESVLQTLELPVEIQEVPNPTPLLDVGDGIVFDNVSFDYDSKDSSVAALLPKPTASVFGGMGRRGRPGDQYTSSGKKIDADAEIRTEGGGAALKNISFHVPKGKVCAVVGHSGAGKSTLVSLLMRMYDPTKGSVRIGGVDLKEARLRDLSRLIGIVPQDCLLVNDTIKANLLLARPEATDAELEQAIRLANFHDVVSSMKDGTEAIVGPNGTRLSGGEKQRLAIARAILHDPRILILDEATSALDSVNEAKIQQALLPLMQSRTCILIAHRLSTIRRADQILVLDHGQLVESGSHAELLARGGHYAKYYTTQTGSEAATVAEDNAILAAAAKGPSSPVVETKLQAPVVKEEGGVRKRALATATDGNQHH